MQPVHHAVAIRVARQKRLVRPERRCERCVEHPPGMLVADSKPRERRLQLITTRTPRPLPLIRQRLFIWQRNDRVKRAVPDEIESQRQSAVPRTPAKFLSAGRE